jgi:signal transduction histidine kinase
MDKRFAIRIQDKNGFERRAQLGEVTLLGRHRQCDVVLQDETISRTHLRVECIDGVCWAEDLDSLHGTFMDGEPVKRIRWEPSTVLTMADGAYRLLLVQENLRSSDATVRAILSTAKRLTGEHDLNLILRKSLNHLLKLSSQDRGFIMLPDPADGDRLKIIVSRGMSAGADDTLPNEVRAADHTILSMSSVQSVFDTGEPVWVQDVESDQSLREQHSVMELRLVAVLCLPLLVKGKSIGVVYLDGKHKKLEPLDRGAFETIVGLCAVAIERARLVDDGRRNRALATVGTAASSIAFEFCNALEALSGHVETLSGICRGEAAQARISQIRASIEGLTSMSTKLLMFADIGPMEKTQTDMSRFLHGKLREWRERAEGSGIDIVGYGIDCMVQIEVQNFSSMMDNLFANSVTALAGRGPGAKIELSWEVASDALRISVADNGKGIPRDVLDNVFEPRFSPAKKGSGGIGLASVKMHVEEHGGTVGIESEVEKGTTVTISLPLQVRPGADTTSSWVGLIDGPGGAPPPAMG